MADVAEIDTSLDVDLLTKPIGENDTDTGISIDKERDSKRPNTVQEAIKNEFDKDTNVSVDQEESPPEEPTEEVAEYDFNGKKLTLPKEIIPHLMKDADYTQKTQTLAEDRNMLQQRQQQFENDLVEHEQFIENIATLKTIDTQLSQFNNIDWQELAAQNPQQAIALSMQYQQLRDTRQNQATELSNMSQQRRAEVERKAANNHKAALDALTKPDPTIGWDGKFTPERSKQMTDFGSSQGLSMGFMNRVDEPAFVRIMHLAMAGEAALKQQRNPTPQKAQPTRTVGAGRTASSRDPDKMTPNEWRIWREADIRKKTGHP